MCFSPWGRKESDTTEQLAEAFDELLSINVPWSQEFSDVLRI